MFTNEKLDLAISKFSKAVGRLTEAIESPPSPIQSDAVLQRFEFTFELAWKALRIYLAEQEGIDVSSPKGTLKAAFKQGLIESGAESESGKTRGPILSPASDRVIGQRRNGL